MRKTTHQMDTMKQVETVRMDLALSEDDEEDLGDKQLDIEPIDDPSDVIDFPGTCQETHMHACNVFVKCTKILEENRLLAKLDSSLLTFICLATETYVRDLLSKLAHAAMHRANLLRYDPNYEPSDVNVRLQIKFLKEAEENQARCKDEEEREQIKTAARSRICRDAEEDDRATLKERAKNIRQAEQNVEKWNDCNASALMAIGGKRSLLGSMMDHIKREGELGVQQSGTVYRQPRTKRVTMKDVVYVFEHERLLRMSSLMFKCHFLSN